MTLIDDIRAVCTRLAPHGWSALLAARSLDIVAADLAAELARPLPGIDRARAGFEEFAREGGCGIEPGHPARSLPSGCRPTSRTRRACPSRPWACTARVRARPAPGHRGGREADLNDRADVVDVVVAGGYRARHHVDLTGDGWVSAVVPELAVELPRRRSAYSVVAAPDFFPTTDQRELTEWTARRLPAALREAVRRVPPDPLSDERFPPNLQLHGPAEVLDDPSSVPRDT